MNSVVGYMFIVTHIELKKRDICLSCTIFFRNREQHKLTVFFLQVIFNGVYANMRMVHVLTSVVVCLLCICHVKFSQLCLACPFALLLLCFKHKEQRHEQFSKDTMFEPYCAYCKYICNSIMYCSLYFPTCSFLKMSTLL